MLLHLLRGCAGNLSSPGFREYYSAGHFAVFSSRNDEVYVRILYIMYCIIYDKFDSLYKIIIFGLYAIMLYQMFISCMFKWNLILFYWELYLML